ncbi:MULTISPECIES: hypothetical protein [unclassified Brachybacterium]|uniref:hypothetical protein n=1 Tax=unclassified Brachybacterium TaxID=2623841 RepID=UPI00360BB5B5
MTRTSPTCSDELVRIAAPPGTGKTTVLPHLVELAHGRAAVADIDEILQDGKLLGVRIADPTAAPIWPAYDRLWNRISDIVTRAGFPMLLFTQVPGPEQDPADLRLLGWEVDDDVRTARLRARSESELLTDDARQDAAMLRQILPSERLVRTTSDAAPAECARELWSAAQKVWRAS